MPHLSIETNTLVQRNIKLEGPGQREELRIQGRALTQERSHSCCGEHRLMDAEAARAGGS